MWTAAMDETRRGRRTATAPTTRRKPRLNTASVILSTVFLLCIIPSSISIARATTPQTGRLFLATPDSVGPRSLQALSDNLSSIFNGILNTALDVLEELITTLRKGQLVQNGLAPLLEGAAGALYENQTVTPEAKDVGKDGDEDGDDDDDDHGNEKEVKVRTLGRGTHIVRAARKIVDALSNKPDGKAGANVAAIAAAKGIACPDMVVLFVRGEGEPGNVGFLTGPPFITALQNYVNQTITMSSPAPSPVTANKATVAAVTMPRLAVQGLPHRHTDPETLATLTLATALICPNTPLTLSGYSLGARVVRSALSTLFPGTSILTPANTTTTTAAVQSPRQQPALPIAAVVLFGDPLNGTAVPGIDVRRVLSICHDGDAGCADKFSVKTLSASHLNYSGDAMAAAMFVMQRGGAGRLGIVSGDAMMDGMGNVPTMQNPMGTGARARARAGGRVRRLWVEW